MISVASRSRLRLGTGFIHLFFSKLAGLVLGLLPGQFGLQLDLADLFHGLLDQFRLLLQFAALGLDLGLLFGPGLVMQQLVLADDLLRLFPGRQTRGLDRGLFFLQRFKLLDIAGVLFGQFPAFLLQLGLGLFLQVFLMLFVLPALLLGLLFKRLFRGLDLALQALRLGDLFW